MHKSTETNTYSTAQSKFQNLEEKWNNGNLFYPVKRTLTKILYRGIKALIRQPLLFVKVNCESENDWLFVCPDFGGNTTSRNELSEIQFSVAPQS